MVAIIYKRTPQGTFFKCLFEPPYNMIIFRMAFEFHSNSVTTYVRDQF